MFYIKGKGHFRRFFPDLLDGYFTQILCRFLTFIKLVVFKPSMIILGLFVSLLGAVKLRARILSAMDRSARLLTKASSASIFAAYYGVV